MKSKLLKSYRVAVEFPDVSGFEVLELLDTRNKLSEIESHMTVKEKETLECADEVLRDNLKSFYERIQQIGDLPQLRKRAKALPSHWWWYMDKFVSPDKKYTTSTYWESYAADSLRNES